MNQHDLEHIENALLAAKFDQGVKASDTVIKLDIALKVCRHYQEKNINLNVGSRWV